MRKLVKRIIKFINLTKQKRSIIVCNFIFRYVFGLNKNFPVSVHFTTQLSSQKNIHIKGGDKTLKSFSFSGNCYFSGYNGIEIGYNVLFGPGIKVISSNHNFKKDREPVKENPIVIGDNVWIGTNAIILSGVIIGDNSIVAAGAIVTKNVPKNVIVAGNPARIIKHLKVIQ